MAIPVRCPACRATFQARDEKAGMKGACPKCGGPIQVASAKPGPTGAAQTSAGKQPAAPPTGKPTARTTQAQPVGQQRSPAVAGAKAASAIQPAQAGAISFACDLCGKQIKAPATLAGKKGRCPGCQQMLEIPRSQPPTAARGASAAATQKTTPVVGQTTPQQASAKPKAPVVAPESELDSLFADVLPVQPSVQLHKRPEPTPEPKKRPRRRREWSLPRISISLPAVGGTGGLLFLILARFAVRMLWTTTAPQFEVAAAPPPIAAEHIYQPVLVSPAGETKAGTAFVVYASGHNGPIMLTALHLFGPAGFFDKQLRPDELKTIHGGRIDFALSTATAALMGPPIILAGTAPLGEDSPLGDVAAFELRVVNNLRPLGFAEQSPKTGQTVWLVARQGGEGKYANQYLHQATVTSVDRREIQYVLANSQINLQGTSGAPLVNSEGSVVGIHLGGEQRRLPVGVAHNVERFRAALEATPDGPADSRETAPPVDSTAPKNVDDTAEP